jgi:hypothetical protein
MGHQQITLGIDMPSAHSQTATQGVVKQLFSAMGIERDNEDKRQEEWAVKPASLKSGKCGGLGALLHRLVLVGIGCRRHHGGK